MTSVCQRVALPNSELIGVMVGASSTASSGGRVADRGAQQPGERELPRVIEVVLAAEEDHLVGQQRLVDLLDGGRVQVAAEAYSIDSGADPAAQLGDGD